MKIDHQENCEYRFSLIFIGFINFHRPYRFFLFSFNFSAKRNGHELALFMIFKKERNSKKTFNCWSLFSFD